MQKLVARIKAYKSLQVALHVIIFLLSFLLEVLIISECTMPQLPLFCTFYLTTILPKYCPWALYIYLQIARSYYIYNKQ